MHQHMDRQGRMLRGLSGLGGTLERDGALRIRYRVALPLSELIAPIRAGKDGIGGCRPTVEYSDP